MQVIASQIYKKVICSAIISLTFWLGGFGCSACCATEKNAPFDTEQISSKQNPSSAEACCHGSNCCQKPAKKSAASSQISIESEGKSAESLIANEAGVVGCSLLPKNALGMTSSPRFTDGADVEVETTIPALALVAQLRDAEFTRPLLPQNRSGTHLRCCVLLI